MVYLFNYNNFKRITLLACAASVGFAPIAATHKFEAAHKAGFGFGDINFAVKIERLGEKIVKASKKSDLKKAIGYLFEVKAEIEAYTFSYINLNDQLNAVESHCKANNLNLSNKQWKSLRTYMQGAYKKSLNRHEYMAEHLDSIDYEPYEALEKAVKNECPDVPVRVAIGITIALCGFFMLIIPIPICKTYGLQVIGIGCAYAADGIIDEMEEQRRNGKKNLARCC